MEETQNYQNHTRWFPLVHFVLMPILFFNFVWCAVRLYQDAGWDRAETLLVAVALLLISLTARLQALKAQDRVIRLEEMLRYNNILSSELAEKARTLRVGQILALRFASDAELPELVRKTTNGEFKDNKEIKQAIINWRGDYLRV